MDQQADLIRQLATFKLAIKRSFKKNIDLEALVNNPEYARQTLSEIEDLADTEELLVTVMQLRQRLLPAPPAVETAQAASELDQKATRNYKFGARSW